MVADPRAIPLTVPSVTDATLESELDHVTFLSVASLGDTVAERVTVSPMTRSTEVWFRETEDTSTGAGVGVGVGVGVGSGSELFGLSHAHASISRDAVRSLVSLRIILIK
jgi:hypothetical protein